MVQELQFDGRGVTFQCMNESEDSSKNNDQQLWRCVLAGEQEAFAYVYHKYAPDIFAFVRSRVRGRVDAEEIAHEVWLRAWKSRFDFDGKNVRAWLFRIVRNLMTDAFESADCRRVQNVSEDQMPRNTYEVEPEDPRLDALRDCLKTHRTIFIDVLLMQLDGMSGEEIAAALQIPVNTVYGRAGRGRAKLRKCIEKKTQ